MKYTIAEQDKVVELEPWINKLLDMLGFSEALVSDESLLSDFISTVLKDENGNDVSLFDDKEKYMKIYKQFVANLSIQFDIELNGHDYIWVVAERLKNK